MVNQFIERPDFQPVYAHEIHVKEAYQRYHSAIPPTRIWGYDGMAPGPVFHAYYGEPLMVRFFNELPKNHVGFGIPSLSTHLHNGTRHRRATATQATSSTRARAGTTTIRIR